MKGSRMVYGVGNSDHPPGFLLRGLILSYHKRGSIANSMVSPIFAPKLKSQHKNPVTLYKDEADQSRSEVSPEG